MSSVTLPTALSIIDLVEWSGLSGAFWRSRINNGELRALELGCSIRVLQDDLNEFLERSVKKGPNPRRDPRRRIGRDPDVAGDEERGERLLAKGKNEATQ